ncbi:MAG: hypothetical protein R3325_02990 [Thermoanaerobaculia bacterium]|nr:hypothetical protein [Thermoanaerobaculia bacterium]
MARRGGPLPVLLLALVAGGAAAQPAGGPCNDPLHRQFDFWVGEWEVTSPDGSVAGSNVIEPILDGCVLQETWSGAGGSAGSSFNFYNPQRGVWQQFWVWRNGVPLELEGAFADGRMTLEGESTGQDGSPVRNRVVWTDNPDGTVRQQWEVSRDGGATWTTAFDGLYRRRADPE